MNVISRDGHVLEIERHNKTLKERWKETLSMLPFKNRNSRMMIVYAMNFWFNTLPAADAASSTISTRKIITGVILDASKHHVLPFGLYLQIYEQH